MINKPKNWDSVQATRDRLELPPGGYVVKIIDAKVREYQGYNGSFSRLEIAIDINDGEYKEFYRYDFRAQTQEDKKWKGILRQYIPSDDGSENDERTKSVFKAMIDAIEESNPGFHWDWDESKLKGKIVGCIFRLEEWAFEGKKGWKAQPFKFVSVQAVKDGKFRMPKPKAHRDFPDDTPENYTAAVKAEPDGFESADDSDGDLPFDW